MITVFSQDGEASQLEEVFGFCRVDEQTLELPGLTH